MTLAGNPETELETVERHIREGEAHVARQREIVDWLPASAQTAAMAGTLLANYEETLALHNPHLVRLLRAG